MILDIIDVFKTEEILFFVLLAGAGMLLTGACLAYALRSAGLFSSFSAAVVGGMTLFILFGEGSARGKAVVFSLLLIVQGVLYALLFLALYVKGRVAARKRSRAEIARRLCYTLPDRENSYVRGRLNTALHVPENDVNKDMGGVEIGKPMKLAYAKGLLLKLKETKLTQAERLQLEEIDRAFCMYLMKENWRVEDVRAVNELCASILKLSAKYSV